MAYKTVCRLCLAMDAPMHFITDNPLRDIYEKLTKRTLYSAGKPIVACYICYSQLWKCQNLMMKATKADQLLTQILNSRGVLHQDSITNIDRNEYNLVEAISISPTDCFEVAASECNMIELIEVTIKDEPQTYPADKPYSSVELQPQISPVEDKTYRSVKIEPQSYPVVDEPNHSLGIQQQYPIVDKTYHSQQIPFQLYSVQNKTYHSIGVPTMQGRCVDKEEIITNEINYCKENTVCENLLKVEDIEISDTPMESNFQDGTTLQLDEYNIQQTVKKQRLEQEETSADNCTISTNSSQVSTSKSNYNVNEKLLQCTRCTYECTDITSLKEHYKIHFEKTTKTKRTHQCTVCQKILTDSSSLRVHMRIHTGETPYKCPICSHGFRGSTSLKIHLRRHNGEKPYKCDVCQSRFCNKSALTIHYRKHTGEQPYQCTICQNRFKLKYNLLLHLRTHSGEKPFQCNTCEKRFTQKYALVRHIRSHTDERPYECTICKQKYREKISLDNHLKGPAHNSLGPIECEICQRKFSRQGYLQKHLKIHT